MELEIRTAKGRYPNDFAAAEMVQLQLSEFGVKMSIKLYESATWRTMVGAQVNLEKPDYQLMGWFYGVRDGVALFSLEGQWKCGTRGNFQQFCNPRFDELVNLSRHATDEKALKDYLWEMQQIVYDDVLNWVFFANANVIAMSKSIRNFNLSPTDTIRMDLVDKTN
jgi:ABC-type transport system substrate-binding protein